MTYLDLVISGLYQGFVMVWPISGDIIVTRLFSWSTDPAIGSLIKASSGIGAGFALMLVLNKDIYSITRGAWLSTKRRQEGSSRMFLSILIGAAPLVVLDAASIHAPLMPGWLAGSILVGAAALLFAADVLGVTVRDLHHVSVMTFLSLGLVQAGGTILGVAPQISALVIARLLGCERDQAAKLALLVLIPHLLFGLGGFAQGTPLPHLIEIILTGMIAFFAGTLAASLLLAWLRRRGFGVFALAQGIIGLLIALGVPSFGG